MNMTNDKPFGKARDRLHGRKTLKVNNFLDEFEKDEIKKRVDIVDLFHHFGVKLTKKGKSYMTKCPWHNDTNPSLSVDRGKGVYNCFGCGESGDIFDLTEKMKGLDFKGALKYLKYFQGSPLSKAIVESSTGRRNGNGKESAEDKEANSSPLTASRAAHQLEEKQDNNDAARDAEPGSSTGENVTLHTRADY